MKTITFLFFLFTLLFPASSFCQKFLDNTFLTGGFALSNQDRRLFYFSGAEDIIKREDSKLDYEYSIFLQKEVFQFGAFQANLGIGYSEFNTTFSRPFSHSALDAAPTQELRYIKRYTINKLIFPISSKLFFNKKQNIFFSFKILPAIVIRKSAKDVSFEKRETKWGFALNELELYPGLGVKISPRVWLTASYRLFYVYKIDEVIFNNLLFYQRDSEFLRKKYDDYNPFKLWFTVQYSLNK
jgi:hypothetical protein